MGPLVPPGPQKGRSAATAPSTYALLSAFLRVGIGLEEGQDARFLGSALLCSFCVERYYCSDSDPNCFSPFAFQLHAREGDEIALPPSVGGDARNVRPLRIRTAVGVEHLCPERSCAAARYGRVHRGEAGAGPASTAQGAPTATHEAA
jgi:hypothetical protein